MGNLQLQAGEIPVERNDASIRGIICLSPSAWSAYSAVPVLTGPNCESPKERLTPLTHAPESNSAIVHLQFAMSHSSHASHQSHSPNPLPPLRPIRLLAICDWLFV